MKSSCRFGSIYFWDQCAEPVLHAMLDSLAVVLSMTVQSDRCDYFREHDFRGAA